MALADAGLDVAIQGHHPVLQIRRRSDDGKLGEQLSYSRICQRLKPCLALGGKGCLRCRKK
jgi:hypothetical protein